MNDNNLHMENNAVESRGGFTVPENYFAQSRSMLLRRATNGGFCVPENYFDQSRQNLSDVVFSKKKAPLVISLNKWWYAAAVVALTASISLLFIKTGEEPGTAMDKVTNEEIVNYFLTSESIGDIPVTELYTNEAIPVTKEDEELLHQLDEELLLNEL